MKYIRTKDDKILPTLWQDISNAIKQANTIEELCDDFIYKNELYKEIRKFYNHFLGEEVIRLTDVGDLFFDLEKEEWQKIYGAIWTGKGLIYVAKMNDKGELELL